MSRFGSRTRVSTYLSDWMPSGDESFSITGGQETVSVGGFTYVVFTSSGQATVNNVGAGATVGICSIGGGGGAGYNIGGGGGGGELDLFANFTVTQNLTITIGASGANSTVGSAKGSNGGTSTVVENVTTLQTALGGGGGGSVTVGFKDGATGGSGGGGNYSSGSGGGASGSNTFAGGNGYSGAESHGGGGGGATAVGLGNPNPTGGQGYALTSIDANLTSANFPTTLTGKTHVSSGGGGAYYIAADTNGPQAGGTNAGAGEYNSSIRAIAATSPTSYGCGGGGGGGFTANVGTAGFAGVVIVKYLTGLVVASGGQETITGLAV